MRRGLAIVIRVFVAGPFVLAGSILIWIAQGIADLSAVIEGPRPVRPLAARPLGDKR